MGSCCLEDVPEAGSAHSVRCAHALLHAQQLGSTACCGCMKLPVMPVVDVALLVVAARCWRCGRQPAAAARPGCVAWAPQAGGHTLMLPIWG